MVGLIFNDLAFRSNIHDTIKLNIKGRKTNKIKHLPGVELVILVSMSFLKVDGRTDLATVIRAPFKKRHLLEGHSVTYPPRAEL